MALHEYHGRLREIKISSRLRTTKRGIRDCSMSHRRAAVGVVLETAGAVVLSRTLAGIIQDLAPQNPALYAASLAALAAPLS
jgi:hypothetical protein